MIKKVLVIILSGFIFLQLIAVSHGASGTGSTSCKDLYSSAKKFVLRAKKLEEKNKIDRAIKLYIKALKKLQKAYKNDKNNPDILNYLGFTLRKTGKLEEAEKYYLEGLKIKPDHNGINEYLGELYVNTDRIEQAKERLAVLKNCNCEEYSELKEIIEKK